MILTKEIREKLAYDFHKDDYELRMVEVNLRVCLRSNNKHCQTTLSIMNDSHGIIEIMVNAWIKLDVKDLSQYIIEAQIKVVSYFKSDDSVLWQHLDQLLF